MINVFALLVVFFALASDFKWSEAVTVRPRIRPPTAKPRTRFSNSGIDVKEPTKITQKDMQKYFRFVGLAVINCNTNGMCTPCTGTLVSSKTFLLAAHCFCRGTTGKSYVYFNANVIVKKNRKIIKKIAARLGSRKAYDCKKQNQFQGHLDIATLVLERGVNIKPVDMDSDSVEIGTKVTMVGYNHDEKDVTNNMWVAQAPTIKCHLKIYDSYCLNGTTNDTVALGGSGDSGGPIMVKRGNLYVMIGFAHAIIDVTYKYCDEEENGERKDVEKTDKYLVWSKIGAHCDWIFKQRKKNTA